MSDFVLEVTRARDLLRLRFEFGNLRLDADASHLPRRLVRIDAGRDAFMTVMFPPQHLSEFSFRERTDGTLERLPRPGHRVRVFAAGESRLGFRLRAELASIDLNLESLLDWAQFEPLVAVNDKDSAEDPERPPRRVEPPTALQTAIELPFRVLLSPEEHARWVHRMAPPADAERNELWHTRLLPPVETEAAAQLWAIWSPDLSAATDNDVPISLRPEDRRQIVRISSDFELLHPSNFHGLDPSQRKLLEQARAQRRQRLAGDQLMLSALGGWLRAQSAFHFPRLGPLMAHIVSDAMHGGEELFSLEEWTHAVVMGRDQYVRVVHRGYLFPFGHRAQITRIVERKFRPARDAAEEPAFLTDRTMLGIQEIERSYATRDLPFRSVRMIGLPSLTLSGRGSTIFVPEVNGRPYEFPVSVTDQQGGHFETAIPMVFIADDQVDRAANAAEAYRAINRITVDSREIAFTKGSIEAVLKTTALSFRHETTEGQPPFRPAMQEAEVFLPISERLLGKAAAARIAYDQAFITPGAPAPPGEIFATILDPRGLRLSVPAEVAGGIASPNQTIRAISRTLGAVPLLKPIAGGDFAPPDLGFLDQAKLLGVVSLKDAIQPIIRSADMPKLTTFTRPDGQGFAFSWTPQCTRALPRPLAALDGVDPKLELSGSVFQPRQRLGGMFSSAEAVSVVEGTFRNFGMRFEGTVQVDFISLTFRMRTHEKAAFDAHVKAFRFLGELDFLNRLSDLLPKGTFGGERGPKVIPLTEGIAAEMVLALPSVNLGALQFQDLALIARLSLFFSQPAQLRFSLSSREHPFLVAYSFLGGGGFFALTVTSELDHVDVEAAIEFGAVTGIDLFIAKGKVQAMVGVYFSIKRGRALLEGYVRMHGSVEVLRIITIAVEFYLSLRFAEGKAAGTASLTVMVRVLMFSKSVTLSVSRSFDLSSVDLLAAEKPRRSFAETISPAQWATYCEAFAAESTT